MLRLFDCLEADPNTLFQDSFRAGGQVLTHSERLLLEKYRGLSPLGPGDGGLRGGCALRLPG